MSRGVSWPIVAGLALFAFVLVMWFHHRWLAYIQRMKRSTLVAAEIAIIVAVAMGLVLSMYTPSVADFTTRAMTDGLAVTVRPSDPPPRWPRGRLAESTLGQSCQLGGLEVSSSRTSDIRVTIQAVPDSNGARVVALFEMLDNSALGRLHCSDGSSRTAPPSLRIEYQPERDQLPISLPISGQFRIGNDVSDGVATEELPQPLLLSGTIAIEALSWPLRTGRVRASTDLVIGDVVTFHGVDTNPELQPASTGVVRGTESTLTTVVHTRARRADVARRSVSGAQPIAFAPSVWARAQAMNEWMVIVPAFALLVAGFRSVRDYHEEYHADDKS